jgi:hypothetical protein
MLIGLCGMPQSGKSEVRKILVEQHGFLALDTKQILREMASKLTGLEPHDFVSQSDKAKLYNGVPRRNIMGELGNVAEGLWGDSFLLNRTLDDFKRYSYPDKRIVVDALRKDQPIGFPGLVYEVISDRSIDTGNAFDRFNKSRTNGIILNLGNLEELSESVKRVFSL